MIKPIVKYIISLNMETHLGISEIIFDVENKRVVLYNEDGTYKTSLMIDNRFIDIIEQSKYESKMDSTYRR